MSNTGLPSPQQQAEAAQHVEEAHQLLNALRKRLDKHPELEEAILKLETALNLLTVSTGAML
jgi:predicted translin family RNA/ssDNA-binding protein